MHQKKAKEVLKKRKNAQKIEKCAFLENLEKKAQKSSVKLRVKKASPPGWVCGQKAKGRVEAWQGNRRGRSARALPAKAQR